jgi:hypothetical protein
MATFSGKLKRCTGAVRDAWHDTQTKRKLPINEWNAVYAAAEHYLYMRFLASSTGDPICTRAAPYIYEARKVVAYLKNQPDKLQLDTHPLMPPSYDIEVWVREERRTASKTTSACTITEHWEQPVIH